MKTGKFKDYVSLLKDSWVLKELRGLQWVLKVAFGLRNGKSGGTK